MENEESMLLKGLWEDYFSIAEKYSEQLPYDLFASALIRFNVKLLMDCTFDHEEALDMIKTATEGGIRDHIETRKMK